MTGTFKLSQNREPIDVIGVSERLKAQGHDALPRVMRMRIENQD